MDELKVIGVIYDDSEVVCFRCVASQLHIYHDESKRQPVTNIGYPDGFTCDCCMDIITFCEVFPTMVVNNTGVVRNGDIEFVMELTDKETGMSVSYIGYGVGDMLPEEWGGSPINDPYSNKMEDIYGNGF